MNPLAIPIIHPAFENLKKSGRWLHILAGIIILSNALAHLRQPSPNMIYFWCQVIVAADIFIMVLAGKELLAVSQGFNLLFRLMEFIVFLVVSLILFFDSEWTLGALQLFVAVGYFFIYYCERRSRENEKVSFFNLGIQVPDLPNCRLIYWIHIEKVDANNEGIRIYTSDKKILHYPLQKNLQAEEVREIDEFCKHYLKRVASC